MRKTEKEYKHLYGPVSSRRLGLSLGVDIIPYKYCTFNCIYCQLGRTDHLTAERKSFFDPDMIIDEIRTRIRDIEIRPDYITFSGSGEPTLNKDIGKIIREVRSFTDIPTAVLTNGSLLWIKDVRRDLGNADLVVPSLDAAIIEDFQKVNRPHPSLDLEKIMAGILEFNKDFKGKIWLEILLVEEINDSERSLAELLKFVRKLKPAKIHLNTVVRPPVEPQARPVDYNRMKQIETLFGEIAEVIGDYVPSRATSKIIRAKQDLIEEMLKRRPCTIEDIENALAFKRAEILKIIDLIDQENVLEKREKDGRVYYRYYENSCDVFF